MIRKTKIAQQPFCEHCEKSGRTTLATLVHHVDRNTANVSPSNLQSLCERCHRVEHQADAFKGRRIGL
jgi:5-methylcytosine-specific restriction endonuclease McrA